MIFFKILTEQSKDELLASVAEVMPSSDGEYVDEIASSLLEDEECEYALSYSHGCLLIRIFDGEYQFAYPVAIDDGADELACVSELRAYAVKEEIPLVITDVPAESVGGVVAMFRHLNIDATDPDGECFTVRVMSEISLLDNIPSISAGDIVLDTIAEADDAAYAALSKDRETNAFWGYDYSADEPNPTDAYFRECAEGELGRGVALALAIRAEGNFVGEATLYAPDLTGGCDSAVRLLPEYRMRGYATMALEALKSLGARMSLLRLHASVDKKNAASLALCRKSFENETEQEDIVRFTTFL